MNDKKLKVDRKLNSHEKLSIIASVLRQDPMVYDVIQDQTMTLTVRLRDYTDEIQIQVLKP